MYYAYAIKNDLGKIYIGQTSDLSKRLQRHNRILPNKITSFTSINGGFWSLVYTESFATRADAIKREKQLKSFRAREFIRSLVSD